MKCKYEFCDNEFTPRTSTQFFCSVNCRTNNMRLKAKRKKEEAAKTRKLIHGICAYKPCSKTFTAIRKTKKYCSTTCRSMHKAEIYKKERAKDTHNREIAFSKNGKINQYWLVRGNISADQMHIGQFGRGSG